MKLLDSESDPMRCSLKALRYAVPLALAGTFWACIEHQASLPTELSDPDELPSSADRIELSGVGNVQVHDAVKVYEPVSSLDLRQNALESDTDIRLIEEKQNVKLVEDLVVNLSATSKIVTDKSQLDNVSIPAGCVINSYILHADNDVIRPNSLSGAVTFPEGEELAGVIVLGPDLINSDDVVKPTQDAQYEKTPPDRLGSDRGLELRSFRGDKIEVSQLISGQYRVSVDLIFGFPFDEARIITFASKCDVTPPRLIGLDVSPRIINATPSEENATITITVAAEDQESGMNFIRVFLNDPRGSSYREPIVLQRLLLTDKLVLVRLEHDFADDAFLPYPGIWSITGVLVDKAQNKFEFSDSGFLVTYCRGDEVGLRDGGITNVEFGALRTHELKSLSLSPFSEASGVELLRSVRKTQNEMDANLGWDQFLDDHDMRFRQLFCDAKNALASTRSEDENTRLEGKLLFRSIANEMAGMLGDLTSRRINELAAMQNAVRLTIESPEYDVLLAFINRSDSSRSWRLFWGADDTPECTAKKVKECVDVFGYAVTLSDAKTWIFAKIGELPTTAVERANWAGWFFFLKDLASIAVNLHTIASVTMENAWNEKFGKTYIDLYEMGLNLGLLELKYRELHDQELNVCKELSKLVESLRVQGVPVDEIKCGRRIG